MISSVIRGGMGFANLWQDGLKQRRIYRNLFKQESIWTQWKWNHFHVTENIKLELLAPFPAACNVDRRDTVIVTGKKHELSISIVGLS